MDRHLIHAALDELMASKREGRPYDKERLPKLVEKYRKIDWCAEQAHERRLSYRWRRL